VRNGIESAQRAVYRPAMTGPSDDRRTGIYRGATQADAEAAYHRAASAAADEGYAPVAEEWSTALGQQVLTVTYAYDPSQAATVRSAINQARAAAYKPVAAAAPAPTAPPTAQTQSQAPARGKGGIIAIVVILAVAGVAAYAALGGRVPASNGIPASADVPSVGSMWFGTTFDASTLEIQGRTSTFATGSSFAWVAHLPRSISSGDASLRITVDGQTIATIPFQLSGSGDVVGSTYTAVFAGSWSMALVDVGGNIMASGSFTVH